MDTTMIGSNIIVYYDKILPLLYSYIVKHLFAN